MTIIVLKLITHEEVLGEVKSETPFIFTLSNPVAIAVVRGQDGQPNVGFAPFPTHANHGKNATIDIDKKNVVYYYVPADDFIENYNQIFGSGIILPNKQILKG